MSGIVSKNAGRGSGIVGAGAIGADAVDGSNIADDAIDSEHYAGTSIDTAHIATNQIDETLMKDAFVGDFTDATVTASDYFLHGDATDSGNTKKDTVQGILDLVSAGFTLGTPTATTSGTSVNYSIPSGTKTIRVMFQNHSQNTDFPIYIRLGDSGGIETSSYYSGRSYLVSAADYGPNNGTDGFGIKLKATSDDVSGHLDLSLLDSSNFIWVASGVFYATSEKFFYIAGSKALSSELTQIEIQTYSGSYAFDGGSVNIMYQ